MQSSLLKEYFFYPAFCIIEKILLLNPPLSGTNSHSSFIYSAKEGIKMIPLGLS